MTSRVMDNNPVCFLAFKNGWIGERLTLMRPKRKIRKKSIFEEEVFTSANITSTQCHSLLLFALSSLQPPFFTLSFGPIRKFGPPRQYSLHFLHPSFHLKVESFSYPFFSSPPANGHHRHTPAVRKRPPPFLLLSFSIIAAVGCPKYPLSGPAVLPAEHATHFASIHPFTPADSRDPWPYILPPPIFRRNPFYFPSFPPSPQSFSLALNLHRFVLPLPPLQSFPSPPLFAPTPKSFCLTKNLLWPFWPLPFPLSMITIDWMMNSPRGRHNGHGGGHAAIENGRGAKILRLFLCFLFNISFCPIIILLINYLIFFWAHKLYYIA